MPTSFENNHTKFHSKKAISEKLQFLSGDIF